MAWPSGTSKGRGASSYSAAEEANDCADDDVDVDDVEATMLLLLVRLLAAAHSAPRNSCWRGDDDDDDDCDDDDCAACAAKRLAVEASMILKGRKRERPLFEPKLLRRRQRRRVSLSKRAKKSRLCFVTKNLPLRGRSLPCNPDPKRRNRQDKKKTRCENNETTNTRLSKTGEPSGKQQ